jgi:hypothetical protein
MHDASFLSCGAAACCSKSERVGRDVRFEATNSAIDA